MIFSASGARLPFASLFAALIVLGCGGSTPSTGATNTRDNATSPGNIRPIADAAPTGRLPQDVVPTKYTLWMQLVPTQDRFQGSVTIDLALQAPRAVVWLHAEGINFSNVRFVQGETETTARAEAAQGVPGVVGLHPERPLMPGTYSLKINYDAAFGRQLRGLYRVDHAGESYAFSQFEATDARRAFPCFDEPVFKTPFDTTLVVRRTDVAITNGAQVESTDMPHADACTEAPCDTTPLKQIRFSTTQPLPTYLIAFAVGPLDVIEAAPIPANDVRPAALPFRAVSAKGKGGQLAYAIQQTPAIVAALERYTGVAYPYDKLDIIAVPDFGAGAMENAGAITFREWLLLLADNAPENQRRAFASVMAHELAHQWFGNLVTMPWWDDIWLNEAFASWAEAKIVHELYPNYERDIEFIVDGHSAMSSDSLITARQIRQPIESNDDIENAFDDITYDKGGADLGMYEHFVGADKFREAIHAYLERHRFRTGTYTDFLEVLDQHAPRPVGTSFRTFLDQSGVPIASVSLACDAGSAKLTVEQSRYLPVGSEGDSNRTWELPICVRMKTARGLETSCHVAVGARSEIDLGRMPCPTWWMPNANGLGYYRFSIPAEDLRRIPVAELTPGERVAFARALTAAFASNSMPADEVLRALVPLVWDSSRHVATAPMGLLQFARENVFSSAADQRKVDQFGQRLYGPRFRALGWDARPGEDGNTTLIRSSVLGFLALRAFDPAVRREAVRRAHLYVGFGGDGQVHEDAVSSDIAGIVLAVAGQEANVAFFDHVQGLLRTTEDAAMRMRFLGALVSVRDAALSSRVLALALDPQVRLNEVFAPIQAQLSDDRTRDNAWEWVKQNVEGVANRVGADRAGRLPLNAAVFCTRDRVGEVRTFFESRINTMEGGPRNLASALEQMTLCAAKADAQRAAYQRFFARPPAVPTAPRVSPRANP